MTLKSFITNINFDLEVKAEIKNIIDKFAFSFTIFGKYEELFKKLRILPM